MRSNSREESAAPLRRNGLMARRDLVAVTGFQFGCGRGKGIAEVKKGDAVEDNAERIVLYRSSAGAGVNTRRHNLHCQSWTISSFLRRVPLRMRRVLPQCGQRAGGLTVCGTRWACASEVAIREAMPSARHGFWKV